MRKFSKVLIVAYLFVYGQSIANTSRAQVNSSQSKLSIADAKARVDQIVQRVLARGHQTNPDGVLSISFMPPTNEDYAEIRAIGIPAISPLAMHLDDKSDFSQLIAIKFLNSLVDLDPTVQSKLQLGLSPDRWVVVRLTSMEALDRIPSANFFATAQVMQQDRDPLVAKRAREIIGRHSTLNATPGQPH
jgi:hypothetical protein